MRPSPLQIANRLSSDQYGVIVRGQALAAGLTPRQIDRLLATGQWVSIERGLYLVSAVPASWQQRVLAACMSRRGRAVASYLTAAALHGLCRPPGVPHITVPPAATARSSLAVVHRAILRPDDRMVVAGVPCTDPARTLLDCAAVVTGGVLCDLVDSAFCEGISHPRVVRETIERAASGRGRKGVVQLRRAIDAWSPGIRPGSPAEMRLIRQITAWGFPAPERQIEIRASNGEFIARIDVGWRDRRLGLEYDADRTHNPRRWQRDEGRHPRFTEQGWEVYRVDKHDLRAGDPWLRNLLQQHLRSRAA
jgi:Transcriptional regulator, AbiEi antitoxin